MTNRGKTPIGLLRKLTESLNGMPPHDGFSPDENARWRNAREMAQDFLLEVDKVYEFDRYINGELMAERIRINHAPDLKTAMKNAAKLAQKGPNGEFPVLVAQKDVWEDPLIVELNAENERLKTLIKWYENNSWL